MAPPRQVTAPPGSGPSVTVKSFRIAGIPDDQAAALLPVTARYLGENKTLADFEDAAKDVEVALQRSGRFLAQVYVPEQTIADGTVTLQVLIGRIGRVKVESEPGVKVSAKFLEQIASRLRGNLIADREAIEGALFTMGDLRGVTVTSSLTPGEQPGIADLTIKVAPAPSFGFTAGADNGGSKFTGRLRLNAGIDWYNPIGRGDVASLNVLGSTNGGVAFARASWLTPVNSLGTKVGVAASVLHYKLGSDPFEALDATGDAGALSLQLLHPLVRTRNSNLFLQASADVRRFEDKVGTIGLTTRKGVTQYFTLGAVGDFRDTLLGGGISNYTVNVITGDLDIKSDSDLAFDQSATGYRSNGRYTKVTFGGARLQGLPNKDSLYLSGSAQIANKNLDSSEKQSLGGPSGVRGYSAAESPSDSSALVGWEYRKPIRHESIPGDLIFSVFGDYGWGQLHHDPFSTDAGNIRRLVSHGLGLTWDNDKGLLMKAFVAARGGLKAQTDDSKLRFYLSASQRF
ncbi:MAG: ShlB/FhaC/HecB family hemolysin secretion/activation protein [Rhizobacter sp.]|nr:ShlB/FhaC/HecB family hemolysin secretion/activation protein [Rhizobacter sp.]